MKTILINYISLYTRDLSDKNKNGYLIYKNGEVIGDEQTAFQTNEACLKCLKMLDYKIDNIISMVSREVKNENQELKYMIFKDTKDKEYEIKRQKDNTIEDKNLKPDYNCTYDYFRSSVNEEYGSELGERIIDITTPSAGSPDELFKNISSEIYGKVKELTESKIKGTKIILDFSGGQRDVIVFLQMLTKMFEYYGCKVEIYYASLNSGVGYFYSCNRIYNQMKILDAVNMFVNTGNAEPLISFFDSIKTNENYTIPNEVNALLQSMKQFNNNIILNSIDGLDRIVDNIKTSLNNLERYNTDDQYVEALKIMADKIKDKFYFGKRFSYENMIKWCLENDLYQQALTIMAEKIPEYLFNYEQGNRTIKYITYDKNYSRMVKAKFNKTDYKRAFQYIFELIQPPRITIEGKNTIKPIKEGVIYFLENNDYTSDTNSYTKIWIKEYVNVFNIIKNKCTINNTISCNELNEMELDDSISNFGKYLLKIIKNNVTEDITFERLINSDSTYTDNQDYYSDNGDRIKIGNKPELSYYVIAQFIGNNNLLIEFKEYLNEMGLTISKDYCQNNRINKIIVKEQNFIRMRNGAAHSNGKPLTPETFKTEVYQTLEMITCKDTQIVR